VISGGELAALIVIDAVTRLLPGVLGDEQSAQQDSHSNGLLIVRILPGRNSFEGIRCRMFY